MIALVVELFDLILKTTLSMHLIHIASFIDISLFSFSYSNDLFSEKQKLSSAKSSKSNVHENERENTSNEMYASLFCRLF